jgi:hypothetical protein
MQTTSNSEGLQEVGYYLSPWQLDLEDFSEIIPKGREFYELHQNHTFEDGELIVTMDVSHQEEGLAKQEIDGDLEDHRLMRATIDRDELAMYAEYLRTIATMIDEHLNPRSKLAKPVKVGTVKK